MSIPETHVVKKNMWERIFYSAIKVPMIYFITGVLFVGLAYIDNLIELTRWKNLFDLTDKLGMIFIALSSVLFIYNLISLGLRRYELFLAEKQAVAALILASVRKGLRIIFLLIIINIIILLLGPSRFYLLLANHVINTIIIASIGWIAIQILYTAEAVFNQYTLTLSRKDSIRIKALYTKIHIIRNITTVLIAVVTIAAILMSFSSVRNIGISLLASAGFLTAIIGLAAQKTLFSLFSGLQIAISQPIKIGDIVVIENISGIIEEITFTYVTLKLGDRRRLVVPINYFIEKPFENWSREADSLRSSMHMFIDYMLPIDPLRTELDKILKQSKFWDGQASKLQVANLTDRSVDIRIQVSAANADDLSDLRAEVREKILEFIRSYYPDHFPKVRFNSLAPMGADVTITA
ncbi:MAG: mechanosensitive ion channel [Gammaproteobacteria bacterium]|nr:mechanosensitive ion channel [Gammaproteobacteria bacterium]